MEVLALSVLGLVAYAVELLATDAGHAKAAGWLATGCLFVLDRALARSL